MSPTETKTWDGRSLEELRDRWDRRAIRIYASVGSTNDAAKSWADEGAPAGALVLADAQERGRGRTGKTWSSPPGGGVYLSMVLRPGNVQNADLLPILAGLGIVRELDRAFPALDPFLKWPNDLMMDDRKFGGVLCEASLGETGVGHLVVGVGINVAPLPEDVPGEVRDRAAALEEVVRDGTARVDVADAVIAGLEAYLPRPPERLDAAMLDVLDGYDWLADRRVRVRQAGEEDTLPGYCVGIAPDGALLFRPDRGALRRLRNATVEPEASDREPAPPAGEEEA